MGEIKLGRCLTCESKFEYSIIGGFNFAIVRCNSCDQVKSISWDEHSQDKVHGACHCGGFFTNDARVRCPKCHSSNIMDLGTKLYFD